MPNEKYLKKAYQILTMIISGRWNLDYILFPLLFFLTEIIWCFQKCLQEIHIAYDLAIPLLEYIWKKLKQ